MTVHTTNYYDVFIEVAMDCPNEKGVVPPIRGDKRSIANIEFDLLINAPYRFTSDEVLFEVYARRNDLGTFMREKERTHFFSKGKPCFRASPLTKTYGWGVHCNANGKMAIYGCETEAYAKFIDDENLQKIKAIRSKRK